MTYTITIRRADNLWQSYEEVVEGKRNLKKATERLTLLLRVGDHLKVTDDSGAFVSSRWVSDREVPA